MTVKPKTTLYKTPIMLKVKPTTSWFFFNSCVENCRLTIHKRKRQMRMEEMTMSSEEIIQESDPNKAFIFYKITAARAANSERSVRSKNTCPNIGYFLNRFTVKVSALDSLSR